MRACKSDPPSHIRHARGAPKRYAHRKLADDPRRAFPAPHFGVPRGRRRARHLPDRDEPHRLAFEIGGRRHLRPFSGPRVASSGSDFRARGPCLRHPRREPLVHLQRGARRRVRGAPRPSLAPSPARRGLLSQDVRGRDHESLDERPRASPDALRLRHLEYRERRLRVRERPAGHGAHLGAAHSRVLRNAADPHLHHAQLRERALHAQPSQPAGHREAQRRASGQPRGCPRRPVLRPRDQRARSLPGRQPRVPRGEPRTRASSRLDGAHDGRRERDEHPRLQVAGFRKAISSPFGSRSAG